MVFQTKIEIALEQIRASLRRGLAAHQPRTAMSVLYRTHQKPGAADRLMTQ
jgi:hypothetical protein